MSDFRAVLDEEVSKAVDDSIKKNHAGKSGKRAARLNAGALWGKLNTYFSVSSFIKASIIFTVLLAAIFGWAYLSADKTQNQLQSRLASKAVEITKLSDAIDLGLAPAVSDVEQGSQKVASKIAPKADPKSVEGKELEPAPKVSETTVDQVVPVNQAEPNHSGALTAAPAPGLYESLPEGIIPKARLEDGMTPFEAYKKPFIAQTQKPKIALVAVNVGQSRKLTESMINELPEEVALAFSPYASDIKLLSDGARNAGHETWMMLPLQNENYPKNDPGALTLLLSGSIEQNQSRLLKAMGQAAGYVGFVTWKDHIYTQKDAETSSAIPQIFGRGLGVIDSATSSARDFGRRMAYSNEAPFAKNNFWLDENLNPATMSAQLKRLEDLANARGEAIMLFQPYPKSIEMIKNWVGSDAAKRFELVPASYVAAYKDE